ncbi:MAG: glycoside hydrolase family 32 protein [Planctomycetota bacterium]|nr:glycoside hydrolase family 32 protein [Planctomycetota bacterium]
MTRRMIAGLWASVLVLTAAASGAPDILIADFEGKDYGDWKMEGEAFGPGPARGTLPNQMPVSGFEGKGLVNSFCNGDRTTGTLASPPLKIERKFINFLIGGGMHPGETCINLLVDGKVVRTATGPNDRPGGTERLDWYSWDVSEFAGRSAILQIVDKATGGWGHINIDHIVQSDVRRGAVETLKDVAIERDYIVFQLPARQGPRTQVSLIVDGKTVRHTVASNADAACWMTWDVSKLKGRSGRLRIAEMPAPDGTLTIQSSCTQSNEAKGVLMITDKLYQETYRPQFHFTPAKNWTNDPNGLIFYKGEYHLFFQHNPTGINWGNMTWGHAVSPDMVHWTQLDHAIHPDTLGTIFSGSGVVDWANTAGFQAGDEKVLVAIYTSAGKPFTQSIAYSNDRGRTWTKYEKNPVLGHVAGDNRDPKVLWHEPTKKWVMALYLDKNDYALFGSPNLKDWTRLCDVPMPGSGECPDFFELPVDGDAGNTRWVFWGANGAYLLGTFDGKTFTKESGPHPSNWGGNCYAAQTWSDVPKSDGRRLQIAWMNGGKYPGMPFNQQMSFPCELTLRTTPDGIRLYRRPVREIETIHARKHAWSNQALKPGENPLATLAGELFEIRAEIEPGRAAEVGFTLRGEKVHYDVGKKTVACLSKTAPLPPEKGRIRLQVLLDRTSIEVFGNDGLISMPTCFLPDLANRSLGLYAVGGEAKIVSLEVYELKSAWPM